MAETRKRTLSILYYIGIVLMVLAVCEGIPLMTSLFCREMRFVWIFLLCMGIQAGTAALLILAGVRAHGSPLNFMDSMIIASGSWIICMLFCALPYYFSGNYLSYLDACFDVMSGLTTTGLTMIQDLDHLSNGLNMWRFILTYIGGQGMVVLALAFLTRNTAAAYMMYSGEAKDEHLLPGAVSTSREIWKISLLYLVIGWAVMILAGLISGMSLNTSVLHGLWIFVSGWSTGGFAPMSQNILYYHSIFYEIATVVFFTIGSFNFALHYAVLNGNRKEIVKNIETVTFAATVSILTLLCAYGLMKNHVYPDLIALFRKGFYQLISGHTTTGFMSVYAVQFYHEWGDIALFCMILAMLFGGSACSTAGGFKAMRIGIIFKTLKAEIHRYVYPESRMLSARIHHIHDVLLTDTMVRSAFMIVILYLIAFSVSTFAGMAAGYSFMQAAFEAASVTGNVGLSIGITSPASPAYLKIIYILVMWMARLEFVSVLTLFAGLMRRFHSV